MTLFRYDMHQEPKLWWLIVDLICPRFQLMAAQKMAQNKKCNSVFLTCPVQKKPYGFLTIRFLTSWIYPSSSTNIFLKREWIYNIRCGEYSLVLKHCTNCRSHDKISDICSPPLQSVLYLIQNGKSLSWRWWVYLVILYEADYLITLIVGFSKYQVAHMLKARFALADKSKTSTLFSAGKKTEELKSTIHSLGTGNFSEEKNCAQKISNILKPAKKLNTSL